MSTEENEKSGSAQESPAQKEPPAQEEVQLRRSGRKRKLKKDIDKDFDYDYSNNPQFNHPKVFAIYPAGGRPTSYRKPGASSISENGIKVQSVTATNNNNSKEVKNEVAQIENWDNLQPPDIIEAHVKALKNRMNIVANTYQSDEKPVERSTPPKQSQFLGSDASKYNSGESDENAVKAVVESMVKVVSMEFDF